MSDSAWVTLATNDTYSLGALVLAHSLRAVGTKHHLAVLITPGVTPPMRANLAVVFNTVQEVNILDSKDEANLRLLKRPELGITFTKLHCWKLTQFKKCVFLDADTLVLQNCDELFERDEFSAAPDVGWPDCFNSGVFVYCPSNDTYDKLISFALEKGSFDGGDQGLLNLYFSDWAHKDIAKHLPFIYNMCSTAAYSYLPAFIQFGANAKIVHFIGNTKPWQQHFDLKNKRVQPSPDLRHLSVVLQRWWDIFCSKIHPQLNKEMAENDCWQSSRSQDDVGADNEVQCSDSSNLHFREFEDPWERYDEPQSIDLSATNVTRPEIVDLMSREDDSSSRNLDDANCTLTCSISDRCSEPDIPTHFHAPIVNNEQVEYTHSQVHSISCSSQRLESPPTIADESQTPNVDQNASIVQIPNETVERNDCQKTNACSDEQMQSCTPINSSSERTDLYLTNVTETASILTDSTSASSNVDAGLAGLFAQCTLGADGQSALEDHIHRQSWEVGKIDYLGRDSFDNIWSKICQTMGEVPANKEAAVAAEVKEGEAKQAPEPPKAAEVVAAQEAPKAEEKAALVVEGATKVEAPKTETTPTEAPKADTPKTEVPQTEAPKPESPKTEVPQTEAPKPEAPKTESPKTEVPQTDAPKPEAPKTESPKTEVPQTEAPKPEAPKTEVPQTEAPKPEAPKTETPTPEAPKPEAPQAEGPKPEPSKPEAPKTEIPQPEGPKPEAPQPEAPKTETPTPEAPKPETPKPESEVPKPDAPKAEAPKAEAPKTEAPKPESPKTELPKTESSTTEPPKPEAPKPEVAPTEAPKTEPPKAEVPVPEACPKPAAEAPKESEPKPSEAPACPIKPADAPQTETKQPEATEAAKPAEIPSPVAPTEVKAAESCPLVCPKPPSETAKPAEEPKPEAPVAEGAIAVAEPEKKGAEDAVKEVAAAAQKKEGECKKDAGAKGKAEEKPKASDSKDSSKKAEGSKKESKEAQPTPPPRKTGGDGKKKGKK